MKSTQYLGRYLAGAIMEARISVDFSRVNFRAMIGDVIVEVSSPQGMLVFELDAKIETHGIIVIHKAYLGILDEEFMLTPEDILEIDIPEIMRIAVTNYSKIKPVKLS